MMVSQITINPGYDPNGLGVNDIAIITLAQEAPAAAERFDIYTTQDELGQVANIYGYGLIGQGATGDIANSYGTDHVGENKLELLGDVLNGMPWTDFGINQSGTFSAPSGSLLLYDFDDGTAAHDAFGQLFGDSRSRLGRGRGGRRPRRLGRSAAD